MGDGRGTEETEKYRFIPLISRLRRQLPPKGKPFLRSATMTSMILRCGSSLSFALIRRRRRRMRRAYLSPLIVLLRSTKGLLKKASPFGRKKTASSLSRSATDEGGINFCPHMNKSASAFHPTRNDTRSFPTISHPKRILHSAGAQSAGSAPQINPPSVHALT